MHAGDPPAERADIELFTRQWTTVRDLLSPAELTAQPDDARLMAAYAPVNAHLDRLLRHELAGARADHAAAAANATRATGLVSGAAILGIVLGGLFLWHGFRRVRRNLEPGQDQEEFAETLQIASDEDETHRLLQRHLDHFKQVNDQRGHAVGDQVLANVGATLRGVLRTGDFAGRNGGEEFAILLPDTSIAGALEIAERVRAAIAEISLSGTDVPVTASIGVAGFPDHASTLDRLERLADAALYLAKRQGRNRVELAESAPPGPGAPAAPAASGPPAASAVNGTPGTPGTPAAPAANGAGPVTVPAP